MGLRMIDMDLTADMMTKQLTQPAYQKLIQQAISSLQQLYSIPTAEEYWNIKENLSIISQAGPWPTY
uniref:Uncharacterized protein n=1 Tax=Nelumbo nucifera TaxID=4432 RepID=A0A822Z7H3_NELNU|nr:TPA_asm: hypothetical protein HUJ06_014816 [Nelumbo nucifera]DAD40496.1 TPA_asm: hypothetical protein HUJ06_014819 [Nelumbo nucifera]